MPHLSAALLASRRDIAFKMRGEEITYKKFSSKHFATKTGKYTESYVDTTITECLYGEVTTETIKESGGKYKKGDKAFRIKNADLPEDPPNLKSRIAIGSTVYRIIDHSNSRDGNVTVVYGRKI